MKRLRKSDLDCFFVVIFFDHTENVGHAVTIKAAGWLASYDKTALCLRSWALESGEAGLDSQTEFAILKKSVTSIVKYVPEVVAQPAVQAGSKPKTGNDQGATRPEQERMKNEIDC